MTTPANGWVGGDQTVPAFASDDAFAPKPVHDIRTRR